MPAARVSPATTALSNSKSGTTNRQHYRSSSNGIRHHQRSLQSQATNESSGSECSDNCSFDNINGSTNSLVIANGHCNNVHTKNEPPEARLTPYQRVIRNLNSDERWQREITLGRRIGFYRFRGEIGNGNFSQVKVAMHCLTKEKVAVKIMDKCKLDAKTQRMLSREISSMEELHHPNLIRIFEVIETLSKIYIVMEYAPGGELFQKITSDGRFTEAEAKPLFAQIVAAIDHMHYHNIIHRDIKAENVFFYDSKTIKVGDFGFSTHVTSREELLSTFCGSPPYAAPELFHDESYVGPYVDYWALGVLIYFMLSASMPFRAQTISALKKLILDGEYKKLDDVSDECSVVIQGLLQQTPTQRLTLDDLRGTTWLKDENFPSSLPKYRLYSPSLTKPNLPGNVSNELISEDNTTSLSPDEKEAFNHIKDLGIDDSMVRDSMDKGSRCNVTGTYRIILHRIINSKYAESPVFSNDSKVSIEDKRTKSNSWSRLKDHINNNNNNNINNNNNNNNNNSIHKSSKSWKSIKSIKNFIMNDHKNVVTVIHNVDKMNGESENNKHNEMKSNEMTQNGTRNSTANGKGKILFRRSSGKKIGKKSKTCLIL